MTAEGFSFLSGNHRGTEPFPVGQTIAFCGQPMSLTLDPVAILNKL
jgi:hypothetical protein